MIELQSLPDTGMMRIVPVKQREQGTVKRWSCYRRGGIEVQSIRPRSRDGLPGRRDPVLEPAPNRALCTYRGRDAGYPAPPTQIRAGAIRALGSHLGWLTAKRVSGQG